MNAKLEAFTHNEALYNTNLHYSHGPKMLAEKLDIGECNILRSSFKEQNPDHPKNPVWDFPLKKIIPFARSTRDTQAFDSVAWSVGRIVFHLPQPISTPGILLSFNH